MLLSSPGVRPFSLLFSLISSFLLSALLLPLFPSPPLPSTLCRYIPFLRVASSVQHLSVLLEYARFPSSSFSDLLASFILFHFRFFIVLSFILPGLAYLVVFSYPVRWNFTLTMNLRLFAFAFELSLSHSLFF